MSEFSLIRWIEDFSRKRKEPDWMTRLRKNALSAYFKMKPSKHEPEIDLENIVASISDEKPQVTSLEELPKSVIDQLEYLGISKEEQAILTGTAVNLDNTLVYSNLTEMLRKQNVLVIPTDEAIKKYDWMRNYIFNLLDYNTNRITALHIAFWSGGVTACFPKNVKIQYPINAFFLILSEGIGQTEHTLVIADENSEIHFTEGCTAPVSAKYSIHLGGTEVYAMKNSKVRLTSLQNWYGNVHHRPVKASVAHENATVEMISINLGSISVYSRPKLYLRGKNAKGTSQTISFIDKNRYIGGGGIITHQAPNTTSEILNRAVLKDNGHEEFFGRINIEKSAPKSKAHMACNSYLISPAAKSLTVPELYTEIDDVSMSHEAVVGRIGEEQLFYLESMGFDENESLALIVNGFFDPVLKELPFEFVVEVRKIINLAMKGA